MTGLVLSANNQPLVLEYGQFALSPPGWVARTGRVANAAGATLLDKLNLPTDLVRVNERTYYVLSFGDGSIQKLTF